MLDVRKLLPGFLRRLKWEESALLLVSLAAVALAYLFIALADVVVAGRTQRFDEWAVRALRRVDNPSIPVGPAWLRELGLDITALGSYAVLTMLVIAAVGFMLLIRKPHLALFTLVASLGGSLANTWLKQLIDRERPTVVPHLQEVTAPSFPSGHAMLSAIVYLTLGIVLMRIMPSRATKFYCLGWALFLTIVIGLSRVYLGVHYPTDVLAGWMAGIGWALACSAVAQFLQRRGAVESTAETLARDS